MTRTGHQKCESTGYCVNAFELGVVGFGVVDTPPAMKLGAGSSSTAGSVYLGMHRHPAPLPRAGWWPARCARWWVEPCRQPAALHACRCAQLCVLRSCNALQRACCCWCARLSGRKAPRRHSGQVYLARPTQRRKATTGCVHLMCAAVPLFMRCKGGGMAPNARGTGWVLDWGAEPGACSRSSYERAGEKQCCCCCCVALRKCRPQLEPR